MHGHCLLALAATLGGPHRQQPLMAEHRYAASICGNWSTDVAANTLHVLRE
jgi:hypothetical protein